MRPTLSLLWSMFLLALLQAGRAHGATALDRASCGGVQFSLQLREEMLDRSGVRRQYLQLESSAQAALIE
ncbi:MAG: hypothetical protein SF066_09470, partial [Thermoanaerobaculia bacterium]|nr:hypothetical protein [Thermoanaerobaculia bacterium]